MSDKSKIEWTDATWNVTYGCTKVSPGCKHCYAERMHKRLAGTNQPLSGATFTELQFAPDHLEQPLRWKRPRKIFVNSLSDLFHEQVPDSYIDRVFAVMDWASRHTFQILTKRPERMLAYLSDPERQWAVFRAQRAMDPEYYEGSARYLDSCPVRWPLPNVWLGVSVENQEAADERIPLLLQTPAAVRFVSMEPLLGAVDLTCITVDTTSGHWIDALNGYQGQKDAGDHDYWPLATTLDWVIAGGESGPKARPFVLGWGKDLVRQCKAAGVPVFVKQVGTNPTNREGERCPHIKHRKGADLSEWPEDLRIQEFPNANS